MSRFFFPAFFVALMLLLAGCNQKASYTPGIYTEKITGQVNLESKEKQKIIILVRQKHRTFLEQNQKPLFDQSTKLVYPGKNGYFEIRFSDEVTEIQLFFFSEGHISDSAAFQKSLGIGAIEYSPVLKKSHQWKEDFILLIRPFLSQFILTEDYQMSDLDQLYLGNWLSEIENRL